MKKSLLSVFFVLTCLFSFSQLSVTPNQTATNLANYLLGGGVTISNAQLTCPTGANGIFTNGATTNLGFSNGVVLSTGLVANIPNGNGAQASTNNGAAGIPAMAPLTGTSSNYDGCMLEFDINPHCSPLNILYKFASEEYPEYVNSGVNDGFGFFISGPNPGGGTYNNFNLATVPGSSTPITIDNVNSSSNSAYYQTNSGSTIVYDGMTTVLTGSANVTPCANYHLILAITDGGDAIYDSGVFLQQSGISCVSPTVSAANPAAICAGQSATLSASGTTTYSWSTGSTSSSIVVSPTVTTTYTVGGSNIGTCIQSSKVVTVTVNPAPTANAGASQALTCTNTSTVLSGSGGGTYSWSGPGIVSGGNTATPTVNQTGTYTLIVTASGCPSLPSTVVVTQSASPPVVTAVASGVLNCTLTSVNASATTAASPVSYNWSGAGITGGAGTGTITVNQPGTYNYTVTNTSNGCITTGSQSISQNITTPSVTMPASQTITCTSPTVSLIGSANPSSCTPVWTGGVSSGGTTYTATASSSNTYTLTVTNPANGCTSSGTVQISSSTGVPVVAASASNSLSCLTSTAQVVATTTASPVTYNWTGAGITGGANTASATVNAPGTYTVVVTNTTSACSTTITVPVTQNTVTPSVTASTSGVLNCTLTSVNVSASTAASPVSYNWSGTGITGGTGTGTITVNQPGTFNYTVTNTSNGCTASGSQAVTQNTTVPVVTSIAPSALNCTLTSVNVDATTATTPVSYNWSGTGITSATNISTITVNQPGTFNYTVTNTSNGCSTTGSQAVTQNTTAPVVSSTPPSVLNCTLTSVNANATTTTSPVSYNWSGTGITSATNISTITINQPGTFNYTVTNTSNGCSTTGSQSVSQDITTPPVNVNVSGGLTCVVSSVDITSSSAVSPLTYTWSGTGITSATNTSSISVNQPGSFSYTITNPNNGCSTSGSQSVIQNTNTPTVTMPTTQTITCASPSVALVGSASPSTCDPVWTGGACSGATTYTAFACSPGIYTLTITNPLTGCVNSGTVDVLASTGIPVGTASSNGSITCSTNTVEIAVTSTATPITYSWSGPGTVNGSATSTGTVSVGGTYQCVITNTLSGCSSTVTTVVPTNTTPVTVTIAPTSSLTCATTSISLSAAPTGTNYSYSWTGTGSIVSGSNTASPTVNSAGNYDVLVLDAITGCTNTASTSVGSNTVAPTLTLTASSTSISCAASTSTLLATTNVTDTPTWSTPFGNSPNPVIAGTSGDYIATVTDASNGCSTSQTITITGGTTLPSADVNASVFIPCASPTVTLLGSTTSTDVVTYEWSGPNATSITSGSNTASPVVIDPGVYTLTVTNTTNGCSSTATVNVSQSIVTASFTANPTIGTSPLPVNFTDASTGATGYNWTFGDGNSSTAQNPNNTFNSSGSYTVTLIATDGPCSDTATIVITVEDGLTLEIPNVFTPNGDITNDVFTIKSTGVKEIALQIFNRWGQKLYEFTGPKASWDGLTPSGAKAPEGTYFYFVIATGFDNKEIKQNGTVNLFR